MHTCKSSRRHFSSSPPHPEFERRRHAPRLRSTASAAFRNRTFYFYSRCKSNPSQPRGVAAMSPRTPPKLGVNVSRSASAGEMDQV